MESWRLVLREGFFPGWTTAALEAALKLLEADSPLLTQGSTTTPPPLMCVQDWTVEACDIVAFCTVPTAFTNKETVGTMEEGFAKACYEADQRLGEPAACRIFLNWFDDTPRNEMRWSLIEEFRAEIGRRPVLPPELTAAITRSPDDRHLRGAAYDWLIENGATDHYAKAQSGWTGSNA